MSLDTEGFTGGAAGLSIEGEIEGGEPTVAIPDGFTTLDANDPAGIGFVPMSPNAADQFTVKLRFGGPEETPAVDDLGGLYDLAPPSGQDYPDDEEGPLDRAAVFSSGAMLEATDATVGATALPRDVTIQTMIAWDIAAQDSYGAAGTIIARGKGTGATEYMPFAVELFVVNATSRLGGVRMLWHSPAGVLATDTGAGFTAPSDPAAYVQLTVTRRWISTTEVVVRYYINDQLLAENTSTDGDIASSVDGHTAIGARYDGGYDYYLCGSIDELIVAPYEMSHEEIAAAWSRISDHQRDGYRIIRDLMPPSIPITDDPSSRAQMDLRSIGVALGFSSGMVENFRANVMPDRAYGETLRRWERITRQPPRAIDSTELRRGRVVGQLASRLGCSQRGIDAALDTMLDVDEGDLEFFAFDNTIRDDFATLEAERWWYPKGGVDVTGNQLRIQAAAGTYTWDATHYAGLHASIGVEPPRGIEGVAAADQTLADLRMFAALTPTTLPDGGEAGIVLWDWTAGSMMFLGLANVSGTYKVQYQRVRSRVNTDAAPVVLATLANAKTWLRFAPRATAYSPSDGDQDYVFSWSQTSNAEEDLSSSSPVTFSRAGCLYAGLYFRGTVASAADVRFDEFAFRNGLGSRPFYWYVFRDPVLGGEPDVPGANRVVNRMRHAFTSAHVVESRSFLCDDDASLTDLTPLGCL